MFTTSKGFNLTIQIIVSIFAIIGVVVVSISIHEVTHVVDSLEYDNVSLNAVCVLGVNNLISNNSLELAMGWVEYNFTEADEKTVDKFIDNYDGEEVKAHSISLVFVFIFLMVVCWQFWGGWDSIRK